MIRRTTAHLFCSVNGVVESPNLWQFDAFGPEEGEFMGRALAGVTDVVIGRTLWQEWSQYWPAAAADDMFAQFINPVRKHVVSRTLGTDLGWNSTAVDTDPAAYVAALKAAQLGARAAVELPGAFGPPPDSPVAEDPIQAALRERFGIEVIAS